MGFLDSILGRTAQSKPRIDKLFALSTATITLQTKLELKPSEKAGICFKPVESAKFSEVERDLKSLLEISAKSTGTKYSLIKDEYSYLWVLLEDRDFEDLVTTIHIVSENLIESGFQDRILCAVFKFKNKKDVYWIYSYRQGKFYPFIPISETEKQRDTALEFRLKAELEKELPIEGELEKWYPLWGLPV